MTTATVSLVSPPARAARSLTGGEIDAYLQMFPPRSPGTDWVTTRISREEVLRRLEQPPFKNGKDSTHSMRMVGARLLLRWLETFEGETWQQRWNASPGSATSAGWTDAPLAWGIAYGRKPQKAGLGSGLLALVCADVIRPSMVWLASSLSPHLREAIEAARDPRGFAALRNARMPGQPDQRRTSKALKALARILAAKRGGIDDIVVGDVLELLLVATPNSTSHTRLAYALLQSRGKFPPDAPKTLRSIEKRAGQVSPAQLVDRFDVKCRPIRDLLVSYLTERQPSVDYVTLVHLSRNLVGYFWADLERHHPGIDSLHLAPEVRDAWKARIAVKTVKHRMPNGTVATTTEPRIGALMIRMAVRGFYLDIAEWALDEPERWGPWAAPTPVTEDDCSAKQAAQEVRARSDARTRERLPVLPALVQASARRLKEARERLEALEAGDLEATITVHGESFTLPRSTERADGKPSKVFDATGTPRDFRAEEKLAFYGWATVEILRHTGMRIEELKELGHHSIISYKLPTTGEVIPLLQIAPSKTDQERLLLVSPELADVLSAVISRVRGQDGRVPSIPSYDLHEKVWNPPMPLLYQWSVGGENRAISIHTIRSSLHTLLADTGITDASGQPLTFQPHDFRRIFITDAILNGLPPHIAQVIAGHDSINTTMGYAAIYPADAIEAHRAFIARRRGLRPAGEYRAVTDEEWQEFLGHFERRKLALGQCGRAYGSSCVHEHACVRCPVLIVGSGERPRLEEIRVNLHARITEAEREGWLGDVEQLTVSLAATDDKISQIDVNERRKSAPVFVGTPAISELVVREAENRDMTD
ncbi:tyrosine-type recombinase/integrase [Streptomyces sp. NPDC050564]|uniref:tyrosine-type recombinase/integrase n=1 Tax=Streptomyces sp. NPDC050564 TaxID=3365631 RepID=UPI0037A30904